MTSEELTELLAYQEFDPWGYARGDLQAALVAAMVANANRGKDTPILQPHKLLPDFGGLRAEAEAERERDVRLAQHKERWQALAERGGEGVGVAAEGTLAPRVIRRVEVTKGPDGKPVVREIKE